MQRPAKQHVTKSGKHVPANVLSPIKRYRATAGLLGAVVLVILGFVLVRSRAATSPIGTDTGTANTCKFSIANTVPAFCSSFDTPYAGTKTQTGDLDPTLWGVSRVGDNNPQEKLNGITVSHNACTGGGTTGSQLQNDDAPNSTPFGPESVPPDDVRICNGQLVESVNDGGAVLNLDIYPKQPFNWAGRTGHVVFDIGNDNTGGHGAWPEFAITDEPVPGVRTCPGCQPVSSSSAGGAYEVGRAKNEVILKFTEATNNNEHDLTALTNIYVTSNNGKATEIPMDASLQNSSNAVKKGSPTAMNHMEIAFSQTRVDAYSTQPGGTQLIHIGGADLHLDSSFTQGLVWMNDVHYNARKATNDACDCGATYDHSFAWDNLGFDGPKTYRDLGFDIPLANDYNHARNQNGDNAEVQEGYYVGTGRSFTFNNVSWQQTPQKAKLVLSANVRSNATMSISLNGHTPVSYKVFDNIGGWNPISYDFPSSQAVQGNNTVVITSDDGFTTFANMSLIMVAAAPVPGGGTVTPTPTPTPPPTLKAGDVNGDGSINVFDASIVSANWGQPNRTRAQGDLNGDGSVNVFDASIVSANWGK